jgi:hypothetical protein
MSRHTRPISVSKHTREHARTQRERHIRRRFMRAKRDGTFSHINLHPRFASWPRYLSQKHANDATEAAINAFLASRGCALPAVAPPWSAKAVHPDVLLHLPSGLRAATSASPMHGPAALGQLAKRNAFWHHSCRCAACCPQKQDGYRRRNKNRWQRELAAELAEHAEHAHEELLSGRGARAIEQRRGAGGWC